METRVTARKSIPVQGLSRAWRRPPRESRPPCFRLEACEGRILFSGEIRGVKFHDLNGDGQRAAGEPGLAGWVIYIDANHNGRLDAAETSTVSAEDGSF